MVHSWNQSATGGNQVRERTGKPVARRGNHLPSILSLQRKSHTHRITWLINKDFRSRSFNLTNSPHLQVFMLEEEIKNPVSACSGFPSEAMLWIKELEMVESVDDLESSRSIIGCTHFPNFEMLDARIASALNKIIQNSLFKKKGQSGGTESSERRSVPSRKTDRLHDPRLLPVYWRSSYHSWVRWSIHNYSSQWSCSQIGHEMGRILLSMTKIPPDDVLESLCKLRIRE